MYKVFGYLNIALLVLVTAPYWTRKLNEWFFHSKSKRYRTMQRILRMMHKPLAVVLLISVVVHAYLIFRGFRWHTGTIAGIALALAALLGLLFFLRKKLPLLKAHRVMVLIAVVLVVIHLVVPGLLSGVF